MRVRGWQRGASLSLSELGATVPAQNGLIDKWTLPHLGVGAIPGALGAPWWSAALLAVGWEVIENLVLIPQLGWETESPRNAVADVATNMIGWGAAALARRLLIERQQRATV